jgi:hypothetical protein
LIEAIITMLVAVIALLALYELVDASNKITKQQTEVADVQQSGRLGIYQLSRIIRQSSIGGLYFANSVLPIENNSPGGDSYTDYKDSSVHFIRKGTDVIAVRGVLLGERYALSPGDVTCAGSCATTTTMTITIRSTSLVRGFPNFPASGPPQLASKTRPFYFVVEDEGNQGVTVGGSNYVVPYYTVGLVNPTSFVLDNTTNPANPTFTFTMDPSNAGARKLNATTFLAGAVGSPIRCGPVEEIRFFVDEGATNATGLSVDTHPSLAQAILDPSTGNYDIQTLIEDVEDFQIAYGVDGADGTVPDGGVSPATVDKSAANKDEWAGNVSGESDALVSQYNSSADPKHLDSFINTTVVTGSIAIPALHSIWISLVVKSADPELDPRWNGPGARGIQILDSAAVSFSAATGRPYRRRSLSLAVSLRNYNS